MAWKPEMIAEVLHECGRLALDIQQSAKRRIKADNTIVTEADTRIEALIRQRLEEKDANNSPDSQGELFFIGEETSSEHGETYHRQALQGRCYVTDPVDGTVLYSNGLPGWGISLGYMEKGRLAEGAILYPFSGELLLSSGDTVLYGRSGKNRFPEFHQLRELKAPDPRASSPVLTVSQTIVKHGRYDGPLSVLSTGSCVSSMRNLALGGSVGYLTRTRLWDLAAGFPILHKLGLKAFTQDGHEFPLEISDEFWNIPPVERRHHWRMKQHVLFCSHEQVFRDVMAHSRIP
ncbi:inositol monophosphatase family protein [Salinispira pacifica]|uniref:Histidinol-phosphatase n=1 Tax=Salinispira pacifica TaxID=1307761 RepID=V5WDJ6_9SPIO|nr:inositol monophosphatase family protein [Salinispira pacifica]AHC13888.1 Histidinol-phosphatase [Salinispira pacifica]